MMDDLNLELSSDPDDDINQTSPSICSESVDDIDYSDLEESDESDVVETATSGPPPPPNITSSSGANLVKENNNNKSKSKLQHNGETLFPPGGSKGSRASKA